MERILLIAEMRGIYIPQSFCKGWSSFVNGYNKEGTDNLSESIDICIEGPGDELYWEAWDEVVQHTKLTIDGKQYTLDQDGDLWAIPEGYEYPEE